MNSRPWGVGQLGTKLEDWLEIELHVTGAEVDCLAEDEQIQFLTRKLLDPGSSDSSGMVDFVPVVSVLALMPAFKLCNWLASVLETSMDRGVMADLRRTPPLITTVEHITAGSLLIISKRGHAVGYEAGFDCGTVAKALGIHEPVR